MVKRQVTLEVGKGGRENRKSHAWKCENGTPDAVWILVAV